MGTDVDAWERMLLSHKNIRLMRIFLAVLVLAASSGATAVLHRCQMEAASCCSPNQNANDDGCDQPIASPTGHSFRADFTCHIDVVVGGVALKQALLEKENRPESNIAVIPNIVSLGSCSLVQADGPSHTLFLAHAISPPSVDRYVLNASFLI
ncbi:MAG: hypothetical protein HW412_597 [Bacteroidetes bacterium]|nr:hypothetical protein [Bacteroidota bacterium]